MCGKPMCTPSKMSAITFDKDLRAGQSFDIFDKQMFTVPMLEKG